MGLIINGTPPVSVKTIKDGVSTLHKVLEAKKDGNTIKYWGQPVSLYIQRSNPDITNVVVNRISSPNQQAPLGNVTDGSFVYYGDVLEISATVTDSSYKIESFKVDGTNWTNGQQITVTQSLPIYVIVNLKAGASWRTTWTGSKVFGDPTGGEATYADSISNALEDSSYETRVSGYMTTWGAEGEQETDNKSFYGETLPYTFSLYDPIFDCSISGKIQVGGQKLLIVSGNIYGDVGYSGGTVTITKVEQYY